MRRRLERPARVPALARALALATLCGLLSARANAQPEAVPAAADCSRVDAAAAARILGYPVTSADEISRSGGVCFFASLSASQEGAVSYAIVTPERLPARRAFFRVAARRCAGVVTEAPRAATCASYLKLAQAKDLDAYFAARTEVAGATAVSALGSHALSTSDALYLRRAGDVLEVSVRRDGSLDLERSIELARALSP